MNKRQAKKYLRRCREPLDLRGRERPRQAEAWRKARGKWSPWKMRALTVTFTVAKEDVCGDAPWARALADIQEQEDRRVLHILEQVTQTYQERMS